MAIFDINGNVLIAEEKEIDLFPPMKRRFNDSRGSGTWNDYSVDNLFMIAHISDLHGDPTRYDRFLKFADDYSEYIDVAVVTGDLVDTPNSTQFGAMTAKETYDIDLLKTVGNHEKVFQNTSKTNDQIYALWNQETNTEKTYYYKDYEDYDLRIIAINPYDTDANGTDSHYTQTQLDWFVSALQGAITNEYGVIVLRHNFDGQKTTQNSNGFYQRWYQWSQVFSGLKCSGTPIEDIIDAFKNGTTLTQTYTYSDGVDSVSVNASFESQGEFIAYICGHYHADLVGYSPKYDDQLYLCVANGCLISDYRDGHWSAVCDMPRKLNTVTEDLFNLYSIDRANNLVKVMRVGADVNDRLEERKTAIFEY